ncbi:hypothetical protein ACSQ67_008534 [Phaseolus vulgaris]
MTETPHLSQKFQQLQKAKETPKNAFPKIQRIAHYLRGRKHFAQHYSPRLVSIGPIHHGKPELELGEKYKLMWAAKYLERTKQDGQTLYQKIASNIEQLKERFAEDVIRDFPDDEKLSWMLFVDGCSLLQILEKGNLNDPHEMNVKVDQMVLVWQDVLLLENQLPYKVLKDLSGHQNDATLVDIMNNFLKCHHLSPVRADQRKENHDHKNEDRNIGELRAAGIKLKVEKSRRLRDIHFSYRWKCLCAELTLPQITVDDTTTPSFHNLIAYEMCPDFENSFEICSFVAFMDSLIDHPEDVKELRSAKVLHNALGSDEEVAKLFNTISTDLVPNTESYSEVRWKIEKHYRKKHRAWIAQGYHTYFSNPWSIIAFHAALFAIVLTVIQTWFAINPRDPS